MTGDNRDTDVDDGTNAGVDERTDFESDATQSTRSDAEIHGYDVDEESHEDPGSAARDTAERAEPIGPERGEDELETVTDVAESPVVKTASRTITPFVIAFGIYLTLFGTSLPGGAFQGGVVMATGIVLVAMAFGFGPTQEWLDARALVGLFLLGSAIFGGVAFGALVYGGDVLELYVFPLSVEDMVKLVEVAIAALVSGVIIGLVVWLASGFEKGGESI
ncbi:MnhB domain-containing protein [Natronolimnohabitans innermongolicus]|uniref:pH adaptation potassium efflux system protein B2, sodium/hydrogen antiporter subunit n=1 Tax=Natronolimnohabitans innermongolicus JCM 12255 TaxID=1227499 RepID=L9WHJ1_9EURY|nr:MnhB domain-containing protein [Natronolimnohabitans innermongolicus]ELY48822.1 pH adaptation potassium efflux system protein B2, sodium/hydrogen antiporter subunit [Natronolimnohabitans innermongolicus JCM 12255]